MATTVCLPQHSNSTVKLATPILMNVLACLGQSMYIYGKTPKEEQLKAMDRLIESGKYESIPKGNLECM